MGGGGGWDARVVYCFHVVCPYMYIVGLGFE